MAPVKTQGELGDVVPAWVTQGWAVAFQVLHYEGSVNLLGLAGSLPWRDVGVPGCLRVSVEFRWLGQSELGLMEVEVSDNGGRPWGYTGHCWVFGLSSE